MTNHLDEFSKLSKSIIKIWNSINIDPFYSNQIQALIDIQKQVDNSFNNLGIQINNSNIAIENQFIFSNQYLLKIMDEYPEKLKHSIRVLGNNGWFLDLDMPMPLSGEVAKEFENGNHEEAEMILKDYFQNNLSKIHQNLISMHPHRLKVLNSAFYAHDNSLFDLSIPVFLSQADGICFEIIALYFFIKQKQKPSTSKYVDSLNIDEYELALLYPLTEILPISASKNQRSEKFTGLNRHQILHGEVVDYGTEINSLKSISLLNYISQVLSTDDK